MSKKPPVIRTPPPVVIQQPPAVVVQSIEAVNSSTHAEASESQEIELNCREQSQSDARDTHSNLQEEEQPPGDVSQTEPTQSIPDPQIPSNTSSNINTSILPNTLPEEHNPPSLPCAQGTGTTDGVEGGSGPVCSTEENKVLIGSVNPPPANEPTVETELVEVRPKIRIQANEVLLKERAKIKVKVALPHSNISKESRQIFSNVTRTVMRSHSINSVLRSSAAGNTREGHNKSMDDIFGRREEARLKRRAERQAKLRAETMNKPPGPRQSASPNMQPMAFAKTMMSSLELRGFIPPETSRNQVRVQDAQKTTLVPSPTNRAPSTGGETPQSETHSGFMKLDAHSRTIKPGSFMHYHKNMPSQESTKFDSVDALGELENEHIDLSDTSEAEAMDGIGQDSPDESDKMDADKSSFRESSPSLSSRTATASPSRSSSYTASRGSRSGSWTKSSSLSKRSSSLSRSRSHNSTSSSTTPTKRKSRRRRQSRSPSSPSNQSPSISRSPTPMPAQNPRYSIKRKKGKLSPDSPVPRKYKNTSTDDFDPDYAAFTDVPPEVRNTEAFCYFGNPPHKEREHTPQSYSNTRPHTERYMQVPRPNNPRYPRSNYPQHSHNTQGGHNIYYDHTSPRSHHSYRGNSSSHGSNNRSRYNYSGGYNTSPHHNYSSYPPHKSNYNYNNYTNYPPQRQPYGNNYSHQRGGYNNHQSQRGNYTPTHPRPGYNQYHQRDNYPSKRSSKYDGEPAKPEKADNAGFGAFYRKDDEWAEENRHNQRNESLSGDRTVSARLAGRLGPPAPFHQKNESGYWKGRGGSYQDRNFYKNMPTDSRSNSDEDYKLNLKIKDIIAKNEQILRRKIESEEDKMIHGVS